MGVPKKGGSKGKKGSRPPRPELTAEEHYVEAQMAWVSEQPAQAKASLKRALELDPENLKYLNLLGSLLAETGQQEEAVEVLKKAVALQPDQGFEKYMYLAQLLSGEEALASVRKGIELLRAKLQQLEAGQLPEEDSDEEWDEEDEAALGEGGKLGALKGMAQEELCSALCALSELLLASCQGAEGAPPSVSGVEAEVEAALGEARQLSPESPEPLQTLCMLRKAQDKGDDALALLKQSLELWHKPAPSEEEEEGAEDKEEDIEHSSEEDEDMDVDEGDLPSYEFRFQTAKLLMELDSDTEAAIQVLEGLVDENDGVAEVWLLLALALRGAGEWEAALSALEQGEDLVKAEGLPADDELAISFGELRGELEQLIEAGAGEGKK